MMAGGVIHQNEALAQREVNCLRSRREPELPTYR
jgi:hypothetical protein